MRTTRDTSSRRPTFIRYLFALMAIWTVMAVMSAASVQKSKKTESSGESQDEPVRLHSDLVVVTVTVTDEAGQFAHELAAKDFTILEDGAPQTVESFSSEESPFAAAILVDMSASMVGKFGMVRGAAASFIEHIRDNDQVAVYGFNDKVRLLQDFSNVRQITDYIWDAEAEGNTRLYDCLSDAAEALTKREERRRAIVMISDGWDSNSRKATFDSALKKAHAGGIILYSIDLIDKGQAMSGRLMQALRRGQTEMQDFANQTGGRYIHTPQGDRLEEAFTNIVDELRNQYTLTYYSTNQKRDGRWRKINVTVPRKGVVSRSRQGYFAPKN